ncbi:MAG: nucleotidyltransferase family protein, partial [Clostridiales bacterium]|nr:nucleotidyltransferase family protein [Clostridiales bacterium]
MEITAIICEYNPLHFGHEKHIKFSRRESDAVICLMSGNFCQRGEPSIADKY